MTDKAELKARLLTTVERVPSAHADAARRLAEAVINYEETTLKFYSELNSKVLGFLAAQTSHLPTEELTDFVRLSDAYDGIWQKNFGNTEKYTVRLSATIAPLMKIESYDGPNAADVIDKKKKMHGMFATRNYDSHRGEWHELFRHITRGAGSPSEYSLRMARAQFFLQVCEKDIRPGDMEWFGNEWRAVVPIWHLMTKRGIYTRDYAEALISGVQESGGALAEGIL